MAKKGPAKQTKKLRVLAIDDEPGFLQSVTTMGRQHGFRIDGVGSLEEAKELIASKGRRHYHGVILDIMCLVTKDQSVESPAFLKHALDYLDKVAPELPRAIVTGSTGHYANTSEYFADEKLYLKTNVGESLFEYLRKGAGELWYYQLETKYPDVIATMTTCGFPEDLRAEVLDALRYMNHFDDSKISDNLARLRRIQEGLYGELSKQRDDIVPTRFLKEENGNISMRPLINHLKDEKTHEGFIKDFAFAVYGATSDHGSHRRYSPVEYPPSSYTVQTLTYAMLDLILWAGGLVEKSG
ncbi:MAG: response regulator [Lentisphaerae bacterium]|jgi:hypothetical protein|nr:response regulator [Lentisphaerota bacterium]